MDEFGFGDRERHPNIPAFCCYGGEEILEVVYVASVGGGGHPDREVVNVRDHEASGYGHVQGGDVVQEEKGGDGGPLRGDNRNRGGNVGGALEH